ncbi:MAG: DUF58 domain-containing protein [Pirellulales bacterium]|nr:DUF58 domain-containing protein [Pirellulales bacterium]
MTTVSPDNDELLSPGLLARLERLEFVTRKVLRGQIKGERRSRRRGQSVEFADYRNYVHGDDVRFIDWNSYARLDRLFLKLFQEEEELHFYALIDASGSMDFGTPTKFRYGLQLAAALGFIGLIRSDRVRIETLGQPAHVQTPVLRGRRSLPRMLDYLSGFHAGENVPLSEGVKRFCLRNPGRGIVVLASDLLDKHGYEEALRYLVARRFDIYVIHVLSAEELQPELAGDLRLVDCEDADVAEISVSAPLIARYRATLNAFVAGARDFCHRRGVTYLLANNQVPVEQFVGGYLRERGLVR